jgi:hypothetical protein
LLVALTAIAIGLHATLPPEPRWEVSSEPREVFKAGEGQIAAYRKVEGGSAGPVQILDTATGTEIGRFLADAPTLHMAAHRADGRYFVAVVQGTQPNIWHVRGVDLHQLREWQADTPIGPGVPVRFSPYGAYVALGHASGDGKEQSYIIHDNRSGRAIARVHIPAAAD